jgi:CDP-6-deoxy-D-xylo-4-hexulose-3-dehydrase
MKKLDILESARIYAEEQLKPKEFIPGKTKIPASGASLSVDDIEHLMEAVLQFWYTEGKYCAKFRRELEKQFKHSESTLCNSGSSANLLAISALSEVFPKADYIITCATQFPTAIAPIYQTGHIPIYVDIDPLTLSPDFDQYVRALKTYKGKIAGSIFAHTLGFPFDENKFDSTNQGFFISDCCDAMGAELLIGEDYLPVGSFSDALTLSFFPAHHICAGEGGAVLASDGKLATILDSYASWGRDCWCAPGQDNTCGKRFDWNWETLPEGYDHKYVFSRLGYNLKMTEFQAALGFSQIQRLSTFVEKRRENFSYLLNNLIVYEEHLKLITTFLRYRASPFGFPILVNTKKFTADELIRYLEEHKITTRRVFAGNIMKQPGYRLPHITMGAEGSDRVMRDMFWIGCHQNLTKEMLDYVIEVFDKFFKEKGL